MSIALCMIVADEAASLRRCLANVNDLVTSIHIICTRDNQEVLEVAESFGAAVRSFPWCDDFSAARNASIADVAEEWILCLDADDWFPAGEAAKLNDAIKTDATALTLNYRVIDGYTPAPGLKLFRNHLGIRYEGIIHESIRKSLHQVPGWKIGHTDVTLVHTGYTAELTQQKLHRNRPMLERELQRAAGDLHQVLYVGHSLAFTLSALGEKQEAAELLESLLRKMADHGLKCVDDWHITILQQLLDLQLESGDLSGCWECAASVFGNHPLFKYYRGILSFHRGLAREALEDFEGFERLWRERPLRLALPETLPTIDLWRSQGLCHFLLKDYVQAAEQFERCLRAAPENPEFQARLRLAEALKQESVRANS
jgi:tetratricopeptide (TPR) repeat protein